MADKKKVLLESIDKLRQLKVSDAEILSYLKEFGIPEQYIQSLLAGTPETAGDFNPQSLEKLPPDNSFESPIVGDLKGKFFKPKQEPKTASKTESKPVEMHSKKGHGKKGKSEDVASVFDDLDEETDKSSSSKISSGEQGLSSLWEKGILNTVTDSLIEMRKIRDELDVMLEKRIDKALESETKKLSSLQENLQTLMLAKINSQLEKKTSELVAMLDERIAELKKTRDELRHEQDLLRTEKRVASELFKQLSEDLSHSKEVRDKAFAQFTTDVIKSKTDVNSTIEDARKRMMAIEERATKTLQLETAIVDGMIKDAGNRIDRMTIHRIEELTGNVTEHLAEIERIRTEVDWATLQKDIKNLKERVNELELAQKKK